jgi:hypothetical protein
MKNWRVLVAVLLLALVHEGVRADAPLDPRAEVAAALKGMGDAANAHDVERQLASAAYSESLAPGITLA